MVVTLSDELERSDALLSACFWNDRARRLDGGKGGRDEVFFSGGMKRD